MEPYHLKKNMVTLTLFQFEGLGAKWWAFQQMGLLGSKISKIKGLKFGRLMGSGNRGGFGVLPNFKRYVLLGSWESEQDYQNFFNAHPIAQKFKDKSSHYCTIFMETIKVHGKWGAVTPFEVTTSIANNHPIAVLTRATIKLKHLWKFRKFVQPTSRAVKQKPGMLFSVGIGELPIIQQATFSLWENLDTMKDYAYKNSHHREVIQKTRELGWYKEELFARFKPYKYEGNPEAFDLPKTLTRPPLVET